MLNLKEWLQSHYRAWRPFIHSSAKLALALAVFILSVVACAEGIRDAWAWGQGMSILWLLLGLLVAVATMRHLYADALDLGQVVIALFRKRGH